MLKSFVFKYLKARYFLNDLVIYLVRSPEVTLYKNIEQHFSGHKTKCKTVLGL